MLAGFDLLCVQSLCECVCVCLCVLLEAQFSCLVWRADGWVGTCWIRYPFFLSCVLVSFPFSFSSFHFLASLPFSAKFHLPVTSLAASSLSSLHLLRAILGREEFSTTLFSLSLLLYVPLRAQCGRYTRWLWNEMSLNRAMCPGATVIAGEIQLPL